MTRYMHIDGDGDDFTDSGIFKSVQINTFMETMDIDNTIS